MKHKKVILLVAVLLLLLSGSVPPAHPAQLSAARAQPELLALAQSRPQQQVAVIVQQAGQGDLAKQQAAALGGIITRDLSIINAFSAQMSAAAAGQLAADPSVRWVSLDAAVVKSGNALPGKRNPSNPINPGNAYLASIRADSLFIEHPELNGAGVTVAVVDSGISDLPEFGGRVLANVTVTPDGVTADAYGHGTHVAGIIAGSGEYPGVAQGANLVNVKVSAGDGSGLVSDVVAGLQWILDNKDAYNIRVANISINSTVIENYNNSPLDAAVEVLWFNNIVVVVSSGNNGKPRGILFPPANDPFVITVGSVDDQGTPQFFDDLVASFTANGKTESNYQKPEVIAPGSDIYSLMAPECLIAQQHPDHVADGSYLRLSGTSMSAGVVSGAVAVLLQDEPGLTPDQVKNRLVSTGRLINGKVWSRYLNLRAAVESESLLSANTGRKASKLLWPEGGDPVVWDSVAWNSVAWNSVAWNSVAWNSVAWNSVAWNSLVWED